MTKTPSKANMKRINEKFKEIYAIMDGIKEETPSMSYHDDDIGRYRENAMQGLKNYQSDIEVSYRILRDENKRMQEIKEKARSK